ARSVLFSNPEVAAVMNREFECAWRKAGEVARARIDFSDGTFMERTLGGNVVTWVCDSEGRVIDVMPGLMDEATYLKGLRCGLDMVDALAAEVDEPARAAIQRNRHWTDSLGWGEYVFSALIESAGSALASGNAPQPPRPMFAQLKPFPTESSAEVVDAFQVAISKSGGIEDPVVKSVGRAKPDSFSDALEEDSWIAENQLRPQALGLLCAAPFAPVDDLSPCVFQLVLHLDASDPKLGLEKALLGRTDAFIPK
ncbi:MAG: hypothetical protein KDB61_12195, partial [Planctomycetes bacterium]|nr:hypothetical protein [Planctomycetota bacterium]